MMMMMMMVLVMVKTEKDKVIWPGPFHEVARYNDDNDDDDDDGDRNIYLRNEYL